MAHPKLSCLPQCLTASLALLAAVSICAAPGHPRSVPAGPQDKRLQQIDESAEELRRRGRQAFHEGKYAEAERFFRLALEAFETDQVTFGDKIGETLGSLASVLTSQERFSEAEKLLNRSLEITKNSPDPARQRQIPMILGNLGSVYQLTGRSGNAEATLTEALRSAEKYLGPEAPYVAVLLSNLASVYSRVGDNKRAEKHVRKALAIAEKQFGRDSTELQPMLVNLAAMYERRKKWPAAESLLVRTLAIVEDSLGRDHPDVSFVLEHLAVVHFRQNRMQQAETELRRAIEIERRTARAEGIRSTSLSLNLARVLAAKGGYDEARMLYGEALAGQERGFGLRSPQVATTLEEYARLLRNVKSEALARQMEFRARQIRAENAYTVSAGGKNCVAQEKNSSCSEP
jgi:tetratricopeptide (TPR) repeat protein